MSGRFHFCQRGLAVPLLAVIFAVVGCGPSKGTVSGTVTFKGKPVTSGSVSLFGSDNIQYSSQISPDGTYSIPDVPGGPAKFLVVSPNPNDAARQRVRTGGGPLDGPAGGGATPVVPKSSWVEIPETYGDPATSGLTGTVNGPTTINLELK